MSEPRTVGWREWAGLPDLGVEAIKAKVDTGARSSSLHADDIELRGGPQGPVVRFTVRSHEKAAAAAVPVEAPLVDLRDVRSSNGDVERRPVIRTRLLLAGVRYAIELTLTQRDEMGFRMLVGRRALRRRFVVDPRRSFVGGGTTVAPPVG